MKRHLVTLLFLLAAIAFYVAGAAGPATLLLLLGVLVEGTFWYRFFGRKRNKAE